MASSSWSLFFVSLLFLFTGYSDGRVFTLQNKCSQTLWPGILPNPGKPQILNGGFILAPNQTTNLLIPSGWSGRFWARTGCSFTQSGSQGNCITGDCNSLLQCHGFGGTPPASLAEFTLNAPFDYYDISLVDGFNVPVSIVPSDGNNNNCTAVICRENLNRDCPGVLKVVRTGETVACKSACLEFNETQYCCTGEYNNLWTCKPSEYSEFFKRACPTAYSYPYDDSTSTFTCKGDTDYLIRFC